MRNLDNAEYETFHYAVVALERRGHTEEDAAILAHQLARLPAPVEHPAHFDARDADIMLMRTKDSDIVMPAFWEE